MSKANEKTEDIWIQESAILLDLFSDDLRKLAQSVLSTHWYRKRSKVCDVSAMCFWPTAYKKETKQKAQDMPHAANLTAGCKALCGSSLKKFCCCCTKSPIAGHDKLCYWNQQKSSAAARVVGNTVLVLWHVWQNNSTEYVQMRKNSISMLATISHQILGEPQGFSCETLTNNKQRAN